MASNGIRTTTTSGIIKVTINITHNKILLLICGRWTMGLITISGGHRLQVSTLAVVPILQTTGCKITTIINGDQIILPLMEELIIWHSMVSIPIQQTVTLIRRLDLCGTQITLELWQISILKQTQPRNLGHFKLLQTLWTWALLIMAKQLLETQLTLDSDPCLISQEVPQEIFQQDLMVTQTWEWTSSSRKLCRCKLTTSQCFNSCCQVSLYQIR